MFRIAVMVALVGAPAASATPSTDAKSFVDGIYARYYRSQSSPRVPLDTRIFTPAMSRLLAKDEAIVKRNGEPNAFDYDLFCSCNDHDGLTAKTVVKTQSAARAVVVAHLAFRGMAERRTLRFVLTKVGAEWQVADIVTPGKFGGSVAKMLAEATR